MNNKKTLFIAFCLNGLISVIGLALALYCINDIYIDSQKHQELGAAMEQSENLEVLKQVASIILNDNYLIKIELRKILYIFSSLFLIATIISSILIFSIFKQNTDRLEED
ncbi:MAG: hypothetical protein RIC37_08835 [Gammaproteobacteria bacterium]